MDALDNADREVKAVEVQIAAVERALLEPNADTPYLREEKKQLREEKKQLRKKEEQLRKKEEQLREKDNIILSTEKLNIELTAHRSLGK